MTSDLKLHKSLYQETAIRQAVADYARLAKVDICSSSDYFICTFSNCSYEKSTTIREFSNYLIDLMNQTTIE